MPTKDHISLMLSQFIGLKRLMEKWAANSTKSFEELIGDIIVINGIDQAALQTETFLRYPVADIAIEHWLGVSDNEKDSIITPGGDAVRLCQIILNNPDILYAFKAEAISRLIDNKWQAVAVQLTVYLNSDSPGRLKSKSYKACIQGRTTQKRIQTPVRAPVQKIEYYGRTIEFILN